MKLPYKFQNFAEKHLPCLVRARVRKAARANFDRLINESTKSIDYKTYNALLQARDIMEYAFADNYDELKVFFVHPIFKR